MFLSSEFVKICQKNVENRYASDSDQTLAARLSENMIQK